MLLASLGLFAALASEVGKSPTRPVLIIEVKAQGLNGEDSAQEISSTVAKTREALRFILAQRPGLTVVDRAVDDVDTALSAAKEQCGADLMCISDLISGEFDGYLVTASLIRNEMGASFFSVWLVDVEARSKLLRASVRIDGQRPVAAAVAAAVGESFSQPSRRSVRVRPGSDLAVRVFAGVGLQAGDDQWLTDRLIKEIKQLAKVRHRKPSVIGQCDPSCFRQAAQREGIDYILIGHAAKTSEADDPARYLVSVHLFDGEKEIGTEADTFFGLREELGRALRLNAVAILGAEFDEPGTIAVTGTVEGADVFIDDQEAGFLPLKPNSEYHPGRHAIRLTSDGYLDWYNETYVIPGESTIVWAELKPRIVPWYEKWWVWTVIVGVAAGATAGIVVGTSQSDTATGNVIIR